MNTVPPDNGQSEQIVNVEGVKGVELSLENGCVEIAFSKGWTVVSVEKILNANRQLIQNSKVVIIKAATVDSMGAMSHTGDAIDMMVDHELLKKHLIFYGENPVAKLLIKAMVEVAQYLMPRFGGTLSQVRNKDEAYTKAKQLINPEES